MLPALQAARQARLVLMVGALTALITKMIMRIPGTPIETELLVLLAHSITLSTDCASR